MEEKFMKEALKQAKKAASIGETPIGAVIVRDGEIIARGYNKRQTLKEKEDIREMDRAIKHF